MRQSAKQKEEHEQALTKLRSLLPPGSTVYCVLRHRSRSGMQRVIDPLIFDTDNGRPFYLRGWMRDLGFRVDNKRDGIVLGGCGMDMGWHLVFTLSRMLYPDGFGCIGEGDGYRTRCPSNDHSNGDHDYTPHLRAQIAQLTRSESIVSDLAGKPGHWHREGSYALRMEWV